jgi:nucleoside-diphosphate-sugar epimerase
MQIDLVVPGSTDCLDSDYDVIFHLAAIVGVRNVISRAYDTLTRNVALTVEALRLARRQKRLSCFVFASTSEVYAGSHLAHILEFPTPEDAVIALTPTTEPRSAYMLSKLYGEALSHQAGIPAVIVRPHNVYGPRMRAEHVIPELIKRMHESDPGSQLPVYSPEHSRTFCFIDDAVELIVRLASNPGALGSVWNVGTEAPEYTMFRVAEIVRAITGADVRLAPAADTPGSPSRRCPSMARTNAVTGYAERVSLERGVALTHRWFQEHAGSDPALVHVPLSRA